MNKRSKLYAVVATAILLTGAMSAFADKGDKGGNVDVRLKTSLTGAAIDGKTPEGSADFRSDAKGRMRLNVEAENGNLPMDTVLTVSLMHTGVSTAVGNITLSAHGSGELELNSQDGAMVPAVQSGDLITVSNGAQAILAGVF